MSSVAFRMKAIIKTLYFENERRHKYHIWTDVSNIGYFKVQQAQWPLSKVLLQAV